MPTLDTVDALYRGDEVIKSLHQGSKLIWLREDWSSGSIDSALWSTYGGVSVVGGRLRSPATIDYTGTTPKAAACLDFTGGSFVGEITTAAGSTEGVETYLGIQDPPGAIVTTGFVKQAGIFYDDCWIAGAVQPRLWSAPFDPVAHRWCRVREAAGQLYYETSPDGATWTLRASRPVTFSLAVIGMYVGAGYWVAPPASSYAEFDNLVLRRGD